MSMEINGATAFITGAASGLGAATSTQCIARGMRVVGLDLAQSIERAGVMAPELQLIAGDVTD